jgi:excisionase family DNA binding protein
VAVRDQGGEQDPAGSSNSLSNNSSSSGRLLSITQVAATMRLSRTSVYRLIEAGRLPGVRVGRVVRVPEAAVDEHLRLTLPADLVYPVSRRG